VIERLGAMFGLHRLALEDVVTGWQRAKLDDYEDHLFIVGRMVEPDGASTEQLSLFLGKRFVLTFQERRGDCFDPVRQRIRSEGTRIRNAGPDYLVYALIDGIIDSYFPIVERIGDRLEALEAAVATAAERQTVIDIQEAKSTVIGLRRAIWPHRDLLAALLREEDETIAPRTKIYLRDCHDHAAQLMDLVESYREVCTDLVNVYLSSASHRLNEVMKVLTLIATIFMPLSFIAGIYGMNFDRQRSPWNMPELAWYLGYPFSLVLMLGVAVGFVFYFRRKGWL
jgi:magnesium transporter